MRRKLLTMFCILYSLVLVAQENGFETKKNEFGFHAGASTGIGLSYRYWPDKVGIQITALPVKNRGDAWISAGVTGLYSFYESRNLRFFGYAGSHMMYTKRSEYSGSSSQYVDVKSTKFNLGAGPGFGFGTVIRLNIMVGYGFYDLTGEFNMYPTGECGLYFRF